MINDAAGMNRRAYVIVLVIAAILAGLALSSQSPALDVSIHSNHSKIAVMNMTMPDIWVNVTIYISTSLPYNSSIEAIAPLDTICNNAIRFNNVILYIDQVGDRSVTINSIIFYDVATGLPVLKLIPCGGPEEGPQPMILVYYKATVENILGDRDKAVVELKPGEVFVDTFDSSITTRPNSTSPQTLRLVIYRVGESISATGATPTATAASTITSTVTVTRTVERTVTLTPPPVTVTITKTVSPVTSLVGGGETVTLTTTRTVYTTAYTILYTTVTETLKKPVTVTTKTTVTTTVTRVVPGAATTTHIIRTALIEEGDTSLYLAASLLALLVSIAAFAIAVRK